MDARRPPAVVSSMEMAETGEDSVPVADPIRTLEADDAIMLATYAP
jgi:hypothetical protein